MWWVGNGGVAALIHNLGTKWRFMPQPLYLRDRSRSCLLTLCCIYMTAVRWGEAVSSTGMTVERWIGCGSKGSSRDGFQVLSQRFPWELIKTTTSLKIANDLVEVQTRHPSNACLERHHYTNPSCSTYWKEGHVRIRICLETFFFNSRLLDLEGEGTASVTVYRSTRRNISGDVNLNP